MSARRELDAAGITEPALRAAYLHCRGLNARHGKTYFLATLLLPPAKRPYVHALYGFARYADDIVDDACTETTSAETTSAETTSAETTSAETACTETSSADDASAETSRADVAVRAAGLDALAAQLGPDVERAAVGPVGLALLDTLGRWNIPDSYVRDFLRSMQSDLQVTSYSDYDALRHYMWGSAAVIGLQMLPILGRASVDVDQTELERAAVDLGIAFQLTNFLRDVGEDLDRGRIYLPATTLNRFGVSAPDLYAARRSGRPSEAIRAVVQFEAARARQLYAAAEPGIALVHPSSQDCLRVAHTLYGDILTEIERADHDVFARRATVSRPRRAQVGLRGLARARVGRTRADRAER